ncbi:MAG: hypothetical protein IT294_08015 [Deltaproteobacteria bacterium]|nr:hypothetical protein [Deltaproteobacteria bacterium]
MSRRVAMFSFAAVLATAVWMPMLAVAAPSADSGGGDLAEVGAKLSNPVSDVWALFTEFDLYAACATRAT